MPQKLQKIQVLNKYKMCNHCKIRKPENEFYKMHRCLNDLSFICKKCDRKRTEEYRSNNRHIIRERFKKWRNKNKDKINAYQKLYQLKNKERINVRATVYRAIKLKKIIRKNCSVCNEKKSEAHHEDYSKPLDIIWLCRLHHAQIHKKK